MTDQELQEQTEILYKKSLSTLIESGVNPLTELGFNVVFNIFINVLPSVIGPKDIDDYLKYVKDVYLDIHKKLMDNLAKYESENPPKDNIGSQRDGALEKETQTPQDL